MPPTSIRHHGLEVILAVSLWSPEQGLDVEKSSSRVGGSRHLSRMGGNYLHRDTFAVADRTWQRGHTRPTLARPGPQTRKVLMAMLQQGGRSTAATQPPPPRSSTSRELRQRARGRRPVQPRWAPTWAQIWAEQALRSTTAGVAPPPTTTPPPLLPPGVRVSRRHAEPPPAEEHLPAAPTPRGRSAERGMSRGRRRRRLPGLARRRTPTTAGEKRRRGELDEGGGGAASSPAGDDAVAGAFFPKPVSHRA